MSQGNNSREEPVRRRRVLKATAAGIVGTAVASGTASASIGLNTPVFADGSGAYVYSDSETGTAYKIVNENTGMRTIDGPEYDGDYTFWKCTINGCYNHWEGVEDWVREKDITESYFSYGSWNRFTSTHCEWRDDHYHEGIDIAHDDGGNRIVVAAADGEVSHKGWISGYGKTLEVSHWDGWSSLYAHLSQYDVNEGEEVDQGQIIGKTGETGSGSGIHLHQELRYKGEPREWAHRVEDKDGIQIEVDVNTGIPRDIDPLSC